MQKKLLIIFLLTVSLFLNAEPFKNIRSMEELDSLSVFSFAVMSDNTGDAENRFEFRRMNKWIRESSAEFVIGLGDHIKKNTKNQFIEFLKNDKWWYTKFYPTLADGESQYYGKSQGDREKAKKFFELTDIKNRKNVKFTEEGSEYYARIKIKGYTIHFISLFYPDHPTDDNIAFPESSKEFLTEVLSSIDKKEKDIIIAGAHSRTGYWLNNLTGEQLDTVISKVDLILSATTHFFQIFNTFGNETVPLAINTGSITYPRLFCPAGYVQVNVLEDPFSIVVQYLNAENEKRSLQNFYYSAVKILNGRILSTGF